MFICDLCSYGQLSKQGGDKKLHYILCSPELTTCIGDAETEQPTLRDSLCVGLPGQQDISTSTGSMNIYTKIIINTSKTQEYLNSSTETSPFKTLHPKSNPPRES